MLGLLRGLGGVGVGKDGLRDGQSILDESILVDQLTKEPLRYQLVFDDLFRIRTDEVTLEEGRLKGVGI